MAQLGKRLTCPMCKDSSFFSFEQIEQAGGHIHCDNHVAWVEMVDLAELMEIMGYSPVEEETEEVDLLDLPEPSLQAYS